MTEPTTQSLYDAHASSWSRTERVLLSDFTARPFVIDALGALKGVDLLDLGCGEGYVARLAAEAGAASVTGLDISSEMVARAQAATPQRSACNFRFSVGNAADPQDFGRDSFDRAMAVFLFNYLTRAETGAVMKAVRSVLKPGGVFVFTVPHPCFPYMRPPAAPFFFETSGRSYFGGIDELYEGRIWRRDGQDVPVRCVHKTVEDYFQLLAEAGFDRMPRLKELRVLPEHVSLDPDFFGPLEGYPLHILFRIEVP